MSSEKRFFFEKKNQKTFLLWAVIANPLRVSRKQLSAFFFQTWSERLYSCLFVVVTILAISSSLASPLRDGNRNEAGALRIRKLDVYGHPFLVPGATISIRRISSPTPNHHFVSSDYGPSLTPDQTDASIKLPAGLYELGLQIPDGFLVDLRGCVSCTAGGQQGPFAQTKGIPEPPIILAVGEGTSESLTFTFMRESEAPTSPDDTSERLHCNIAGVPAPMAPTDVLTFKASDSWVKVGVNRTIGDVLVLLDLINPLAPDKPVSLIDARSAGGAAWQISLGGIDAKTGETIHFNQGAGNSARVWGYEAPLSATADSGFAQQGWLPLFSDDRRRAGDPPTEAIGTSPCYNTGIRIGDGKFSLTYRPVRVGRGNTITRLVYGYLVRHRISTDWQRFQFDYGIYFDPQNRDLRVYFPGKGQLVGPVYPYRDLSATPREQVRNVVCEAGDCLVATVPISYAVLIWSVHGENLAIAIHRANPGEKFDGFLRFRPHVTCTDGARCGGVQWHAEVADTALHPDQKHEFKAGDITRYQLVYDIGTPAELAQLGYRSE